ncbi:MAG: helix-turn-helix domain-containing protein [Coxiellaceae bacterium]|nr:helix-turn-helix domain-containing protein [Coxiellaceae bacterium]
MTEKNKTPGQILRAAREAQSLSTADIAKEMRLSLQAVDALERDEYGNMGVRTFVRGYLATYARIVSVSQATILELFDAVSPMPEIIPSSDSAVEGAPIVNVTRERTAFRYSPKILIGAAIFIFILFALVFHSGKTTTTVVDTKKDDAKTVVSSAEPAIVIPAETTALAAAVPSATTQKTADVETPKVMTPTTLGQANPGTNTPFIRKSVAHVASKPKAPVHHAATYTISPVTPE